MKYPVCLAFIFFSYISSLSAQDAVDIIAEKTCSCLKNMDMNASSKQLTDALGTCMFREAGPYQKELKKKEHIDLDKLDDKVGEQFGQLIGSKMVLKCPDLMIKLAGAANEPKPDGSAPVSTTLTGIVTDISPGQFVVITVKDPNGPEQKFLWLGYFKGAELLKNGLPDIKGKTVAVSYTENDYYNPAIKDYMKYKIITGLSAK